MIKFKVYKIEINKKMYREKRLVKGIEMKKESFLDFKKKVVKGRKLEISNPLGYYRKISIPISYVLSKTKVTANQISIVNLFISIIGCLLFIVPQNWILASLVLQLYIILDHVDGELARAKNQRSERGYFLDNLAHYLMKGLLPLGISLGLYNLYLDEKILILGGMLIFFIMTEHLLIYVNKSRGLEWKLKKLRMT